MSNLQKYNEVFINVFDASESNFSEEFSVRTVDKWDSITHLSLITEIEDAFDVMLDSDDILEFVSHRLGKEILAKYDVVVE